MMSHPDEVDVDIPHGIDGKMNSKLAMTTDNLKTLPPRSSTPTRRRNSSSGHGGDQQHEPLYTPTHQGQSIEEPLSSSVLPPKYSAWAIGSTEGLLRALRGSNNPNDRNSTQNIPDNNNNNNKENYSSLTSAMLANFHNGPANLHCYYSPSPSPDHLSDATSSTQTNQTNHTSVSTSMQSPVITTSPQDIPPTLRGLSQKRHSHEPHLPNNPNINVNTHNHASNPLKLLYLSRLLSTPNPAVESLLASSCEALNFDIAEMWLRTGPKTHQLTNSHIRPTALDESVRKQLVDVYYGERSAERTHRLSPALCKRAKEACDVVWVTAHTVHGAEALKCSISDVRTAVAVPVCHFENGVNITIIYFSIRRAIMKPQAVEFLVHMALATATVAVNCLAEEVMGDEMPKVPLDASVGSQDPRYQQAVSGTRKLSKSAHLGKQPVAPSRKTALVSRDGPHRIYSVTGAQLNLDWDSLRNLEYLTDGGNNWIHTAVLHGKSVVVKTLKPECQDVAMAMNEIEGELEIHSRLDHPNIVSLIGAGMTPRGVRFVVLERLDGGTLTQLLGYDNRIRDRRRRFWTKRKKSYVDVLKCARQMADALAYCHGRAIPNAMVLHRDLKPDNVGFTLDGTVKLIDFGLARIVENTTVSDAVYEMSGETGSLRYMAPEVADCKPYNQKADVYSFGVILWELVEFKKPYDGMNKDEFYHRVVHGGERPPLNKKWPEDLTDLLSSCWHADIAKRPDFSDVTEILDSMLSGERGADKKKKNRFAALIDRHSTWF